MASHQAIRKYAPMAIDVAGRLREDEDNPDAVLASLLIWLAFGEESGSRQSEKILDGLVEQWQTKAQEVKE